MKKYLMCALILCAIPAVALGQSDNVNVNCESCSHQASVYMGNGGFIATADDADMVTWVSTCDGVTVSGELEPNDDGVVMELFTMDNGLACMDEDGGTFQLGPIEDGGWFWITDDMSSAVGGLVAKDLFDDKGMPKRGLTVASPTNAGEGVTMMAGKGAVFLKETSSGRVGILPNILPEPPTTPAAKCGPRQDSSGSWNVAASEKRSDCMLGDGGSKIRLRGTDAHGNRYTVGSTMYRPTAGHARVVNADLWVNQDGSITTANPPTPAAGWPVGTNPMPLDATFSVGAATGVGGANVNIELNAQAVAGVSLTENGDVNDVAAISIEADSDYCKPSAKTNIPVTITISAMPGPENAVAPSVAAAKAKLTIMCPPASANQGTDLVPDNPFPPTSE